jgi:hypothetical protein
VYIFRKLYADVYQVALLDDRSEPTSVYRISPKGCSCPSRSPCKHQSMLKAFKGLNNQSFWGFEMVDKEIKTYNLDNYYGG